jgi:hypothetical protein
MSWNERSALGLAARAWFKANDEAFKARLARCAARAMDLVPSSAAKR